MSLPNISRCALVALLFTLLIVAKPRAAQADPCGMVPPVSVDFADNLPIKRVGPQKTYVFYKGGLETFIIRPGYEGKVDEFGMLIPFPVPPAIRKAPDNFFEQLAAAIDPPEVVVDLTPRPTGGFFGGGFGGGGGLGGGGLGFAPPARDEVKVVREEAVGMYEVAVLAAGSAKALKTWLDQHQYNYPSGMDLPAEEYVKQSWCFVAVKTRVVVKDKADPKPAQRDVDAKLPEGSIFDGHVQAMEFRFPSKELVVPMRLSAYNEGETRNIVYLLADKPAKIRNIPEEYVMRQMSGEELYDNLTEPLPVRVIGGTIRDIPAATRRGLDARRNPAPHNGVAADIFAGDLLAAKTGTLLSEHEVQEKELLAIGEELDLRGQAFDAAIGRTLGKPRSDAKAAVLKHVKDMTITIVDGDFPREVLAKDNLRFAQYEMPRRKSSPEFYDANEMGPAGPKQGKRYTGSIDWGAIDRASRIADARPTGIHQQPRNYSTLWVMLLGGVSLVAAGFARGRSRKRLFVWIVVIVLTAVAYQSGVAVGDEPQHDDAKVDEAEVDEPEAPPLSEAEITALLRDLDDAKTARAAVERLGEQGEEIAPRLITIAKRDKSLPRRGWAIAALGRIGGDEAHECLQWLNGNKKQPELIRLWAAAAIVKSAATPEEFEAAVKIVDGRAALQRPLAKNVERQLQAGDADVSLIGLLMLCVRNQQYERFLAGPIVAQGGAALVEQMLTHEDQDIRRKAAGFVGTAAAAGDERVAADIAGALAFDPEAEAVPWNDGPLFIPGINWDANKEQAKALTHNLIAWHVWCDARKLTDEQAKINVNLGSVALSSAAGYNNLGQRNVASARWVESWKEAAGEAAIETMLSQQGLAFRDGKLTSL